MPYGPRREARLEALCREWTERLGTLELGHLSRTDRLDALLFRNHLLQEARALRTEHARFQEMLPLLPFAAAIQALEEARWAMEPGPAPQEAAERLAQADRDTKALEKRLADQLKGDKAALPKAPVVFQAAETAARLRGTLKAWHEARKGYDPLYTWWLEEPVKGLDQTLARYGKFLVEEVLGDKEGRRVVGVPVGRERLLEMLRLEFISYDPEELVEIANREFAWCEAEARKASLELGLGGDWKKAVEHVKRQHGAPGEQPAIIRRLFDESVRFIEERRLITLPPLAKEDWGLRMLSEEAQKVNPFFLGGEDIFVSFPTSAMPQDAKLMSLRGNNIHFCRATVHHELLPGHHLQTYMGARVNTHRQIFENPFWIEGWPLHWEMRLYDLGFARNAADRVGMLFWRMHRCARIIFSLGFHLGRMSPEQCVDFLVDRVGHERANAEAEVRRSFNGSYGPLYQLAYMVGGLQLRALHRELVLQGGMPERAFHDAVIQAGPMPIELLRAHLKGEALDLDRKTSWRFCGEVGT